MKKFDWLLSLGLTLVLGCLLGLLGFNLWDKSPVPVQQVAWSNEAQWISPSSPSYRLYARHTFYVSDKVQASWLRISADNNFILYLNGKQIGRQLGTTNSSLGFTERNSFSFQDVNDSVSYNVKGENRFLAYPNNWKLTFYADLTKAIRPGKNVIAIEVQKSQTNPRVAVEGYVYPTWDSQPIKLTTGVAPWKVAVLSGNRQGVQWFEPEFPDEGWATPEKSSILEATYSRLSQNLFDRQLQGSWITGVESHQGEVWLRKDWQIPRTQQRAFVRFSGAHEYSLLINGQLVNSSEFDTRNVLYLYEVTNLLKPGSNTLAVRLARPVDQNSSTLQNSSPAFFLDGWVETEQDNVVAAIMTDSSWQTLPEPIANWDMGAGQGQSATFLNKVDPQSFNRQFQGDAYLLNCSDFLLRRSLWQTGGIAFAIFYIWGTGWVWTNNQDGWQKNFFVGTGLLLPGTLFLIGVELLKHRYAESEQGLLFAQAHSNILTLLGFVGVVLWSLLWCLGNPSKYRQNKPLSFLQRCLLFSLGVILFICLGIPIRYFSNFWSISLLLVLSGVMGLVIFPFLPQRGYQIVKRTFRLIAQTVSTEQPAFKWLKWVVLIVILSIGFGLRVYALDAIARDSDENTSLDAIRGILNTGAPIATSGIWYTRGPLYHYVVALWLKVVGFSSVNARFLSVIFGTVTLIFVFLLARKITGKVWLALLITALLAIDPWELAISRNTRFYQFLQLDVTLAFWSFYKGFIDQAGKRYQYIFLIAITASLLTQEGSSLALLPCFFIGSLCFYRPFRWSSDWSIALASFLTLLIYAFNGVFFVIKCLTAPVAISSGSSTPVQLHLFDLAGFTAGLMVGSSRINILYSLFLLLGFIYFLRRKNGVLIFLFSSVFIFLLDITLLITQVSPRYTFSIYPLFVTLSIYSAFCILDRVGRGFEYILKHALPLRAIALCSLVFLLFSNIEFSRTIAAYKDALARQNPQIFEYIKQNRQEGDVVVANLPAAAAITLNGLDYYLPPKGILSMDGFYLKNGQLVDRWAGGVVINSVDKFNKVLEKADRVWLQLDDNLQPHEPNQLKLYNYVRSLGESVYEPYGVQLRLWRKENGLLPQEPTEGKDLGNY